MHRRAQATTAIQIAIALLTRRRWLQWGVYAVIGVWHRAGHRRRGARLT
jgi:hypothetical protein